MVETRVRQRSRPLQVLGFAFVVRSTLPGLVEHLELLLSEWAGADAASDAHEFIVEQVAERWLVRLDGEPLAECPDPGSAVDSIVSAVTREALSSEDERVALHAAAVVGSEGALLIAGPSGSGKSTVAAALVQRGYGYLSDEIALVDATGLVHPFARPIGLDERAMAWLDLRSPPRGQEPFRHFEHHVTTADLQGSLASPTKVAAIIEPQIRWSATAQLAPLSRPNALRLLMSESFHTRAERKRAVRVLADVVWRARCYRLTSGNVLVSVTEIERVFARIAR